MGQLTGTREPRQNDPERGFCRLSTETSLSVPKTAPRYYTVRDKVKINLERGEYSVLLFAAPKAAEECPTLIRLLILSRL